MRTGLILGSSWFVLFVLGQIALVHAVGVRHRFKAIAAMLGGSLAGLGASSYVLATATLFGEWLRGGWMCAGSGIMVLLCLFVLYMPFYYVVATSLSVRTLIQVQRGTEGRRSVEELMGTFVSEELARQRLETMAANGYLVVGDGGFGVTAKGRCVAGISRLVKRAWRLGLGG